MSGYASRSILCDNVLCLIVWVDSPNDDSDCSSNRLIVCNCVAELSKDELLNLTEEQCQEFKVTINMGKNGVDTIENIRVLDCHGHRCLIGFGNNLNVHCDKCCGDILIYMRSNGYLPFKVSYTKDITIEKNLNNILEHNFKTQRQVLFYIAHQLDWFCRRTWYDRYLVSHELYKAKYDDSDVELNEFLDKLDRAQDDYYLWEHCEWPDLNQGPIYKFNQEGVINALKFVYHQNCLNDL